MEQEDFEDTNGVIRIHKSKKNRQHNGQKKNRQHNGQKKNRQHNGQKTKKDKITNNDLQNTTQKTKDRANSVKLWV